MIRKIIILTSIILFSGIAFGQLGLKGGYEYAYYRRPFYNMDIAAYNFNHLNPGVTDDLKIPRVPGGMFMGFVCGNRGMLEFTWHNFHGTDKGKYTNNGVDTISIFKHRLNYTSIAVNIPVADNGLSAGFSLDLGNFKVFKKKSSAEGLDTTEFVNFYSNYGHAFGISAFLNYSYVITNGISINVRPFYHWFIITNTLQYDGPAGTQEYYLNLNNFGVQCFILLGGSSINKDN